MRTAHAYLRVSTATQDADNQRRSVDDYAARAGFTLATICKDEASTMQHWRSRAIASMIAAALPGEHIICAEVSRAARSVLEVLEIAKACAERGISLHFAKNSLVLDATMQSRITVTVLALAAEIERDFISARTKEALAARKAAGGKLGRPAGSQNKKLKLSDRDTEMQKYLRAHVSLSAIARIMAVSTTTLRRYLKRAQSELTEQDKLFLGGTNAKAIGRARRH